MGQDDTLCGVVKSVIACTADPSHFKRTVKYSCDNPDCPTCYQDYLKHDALGVKESLELARVELRKAGLDPGHPYHFWLSPPPSQRNQPLNTLRRQALHHAMQLGIIGGYIFDHPYRGTPQQLERYRDGELDLDYSPHFHIIGFLPRGFPAEKSNAFNKRTGWTYGNKLNVNKRGKPRNIYETAKYELGHAARETWHKHRLLKRFGIMHASKIKAIVDKAREEMSCPRCGAEVARYDPDSHEYLGPARIRPQTHLELRPGSISWLVERWKLEIRPVHLDLTKLCEVT